jgi:hypothetical protein
LLKELAESASMLGADKFVLLYSKDLERGMPARSQGFALLQVLQELEMALLGYIQTHPNTVARVDAALPPLL